jgi:DNA (cytosine-5)-methyltransferase 1
MSVEKDPAAHKTLTLRAFVRRFRPDEVPGSYYEYVSGRRTEPWDLLSAPEWKEAHQEAMHGTLGDAATDEKVRARLTALKLKGKPWVLIGGPPCQAYSLVGRARNAGNSRYKAERDDRHLLYQQYLNVLHDYEPPVFVMENVKGILSSTLRGKRIFSQVLADLADPSLALGKSRTRAARYRIRAVCNSTVLERAGDAPDIDQNAFVVESESFGVPQRRHRVILIGVREGLDAGAHAPIEADVHSVHVCDALGNMPRLRSGLSEDADTQDRWLALVRRAAKRLRRTAARSALHAMAEALDAILGADDAAFPPLRSSQRLPSTRSRAAARALNAWYSDPRLQYLANHETRAHMTSDLERYLFCAVFGRTYGRSPRSRDFPTRLAPNHASWEMGAFADRFNVQLADSVSSTITSHIAKDGHYFIHYDPYQCRTLTVREAARLQTFPDNYFFEGTRTQQYTQVGNAVPPLLARRIAAVVHAIVAQ